MKLMKILRTAFVLATLITVMDLCGFSNYNTYEVKAVTFDEVNHPNVFLKQINGDKQCTLVAATMMIRRAAMLSGNANWADITVDKVKEQAWIEGVGLRYTFTYAGITVNKLAFGPDPVNESMLLLKQHPEGIVLYDQKRSPRSHAVLLTDYTNTIFYGADPAEAVPSGRILNSSALVQVKDAEFYWYVSSPSISSPLPSLTEENNRLPIDISTYPSSLSQTTFYYDGTEIKPIVTVPGLTENVDFIVSYFNNVNPGTAIISITGIGAYSGTITKNYDITEVTSLDTLNNIKNVIAKQTIKKGKTTVIKVTLPDSLESVKEFSGNPLRIYNEVKISYASGNKKIAAVNSSGKITGKKKGASKIYVTIELVDGTKKTFALAIKVT